MHNLEARFIEVQVEMSRSGSQNSPTLLQLFPQGEAMNVRIMIDKYRSIFSEACSGQIMCVILRRRGVSVLMSFRTSVHAAMEVITRMREQMEESKQMDKSIITRT
jgi:hypothetical protein